MTEFQWKYKAEVVNIVDGDTIDCKIQLGFRIEKELRVRLYGVDTAETYGVTKESDEYKTGKEHEQFVRDWIADADALVLETIDDEKGKYGRYLADFYNESDESLTNALVESYPSVEQSYD